MALRLHRQLSLIKVTENWFQSKLTPILDIHWLIFILLYLLDFLHTVQILLYSHH